MSLTPDTPPRRRIVKHAVDKHRYWNELGEDDVRSALVDQQNEGISN